MEIGAEPADLSTIYNCYNIGGTSIVGCTCTSGGRAARGCAGVQEVQGAAPDTFILWTKYCRTAEPAYRHRRRSHRSDFGRCPAA